MHIQKLLPCSCHLNYIYLFSITYSNIIGWAGIATPTPDESTLWTKARLGQTRKNTPQFEYTSLTKEREKKKIQQDCFTPRLVLMVQYSYFVCMLRSITLFPYEVAHTHAQRERKREKRVKVCGNDVNLVLQL